MEGAVRVNTEVHELWPACDLQAAGREMVGMWEVPSEGGGG